MTNSIVSNTKNSTKTLAQKIAQQMAQEPLEILKSVEEQVKGESVDKIQELETNQKVENQKNENHDRLISQRHLEALNRELDDIRKQRIFKELQRRISMGEEVPLEEYPELSMEQKQVLKAQMEAVKNQRLAISDQPLEEPVAKKGRQLFNFGKKTAMKREQTRVENPGPPSG